MNRPYEYLLRRLSRREITPDPLQIRVDQKGKRKMPTSKEDNVGLLRLLKLWSKWPRTILAATALAIIMTAPATAVPQGADKQKSEHSLVVEGWLSCILGALCIDDPEVLDHRRSPGPLDERR